VTATATRSPRSSAATGAKRGSGGRWLALGEASRVLGVDVTTLRRWADAGEIQAFRTPGGHRRFTDADLATFVRRRHSATARLSDVFGADGVRLLPAGSGRMVRTQPWYRAVRGPHAAAIGHSCRRLMAGLAAYLAGEGPTARRRGEAAARALGTQIAALGLSAAEATEAFLFFRQAIAQAVSSRFPLHPRRKIQSIRRADEYFNRIQAVLMAAYGRRTNPRGRW
jgi:excisionase family DNA binding protein